MKNHHSPTWRLSWLLGGVAGFFFAISASPDTAFLYGVALAVMQVSAALLPLSFWQKGLVPRLLLYTANMVAAVLWVYYSGVSRANFYPEVLFWLPLLALFLHQRREAVALGLLAVGIAGCFLLGQERYAVWNLAAELGGWAALTLAAWILFNWLWDEAKLAASRGEVLEALRQEYKEVKARLAQAEYLALIDELTQLHNLRYFEQSLEKMLQELRYLSALSVLMVDVDYFKEVNDTYGHLVGNQVLIELGCLLKQQVREKDVVARYGGEEFALILPGVDCRRAQQVAERIRQAIAEHIFARDKGLEIRLTVSIGIATWPRDAQDKAGLLGKADAALYAAKTTGRNTVCAYQLLAERERAKGEATGEGGGA